VGRNRLPLRCGQRSDFRYRLQCSTSLGLRPGEDEDPLEDGDEAPEFARDFLGEMEGR